MWLLRAELDCYKSLHICSLWLLHHKFSAVFQVRRTILGEKILRILWIYSSYKFYLPTFNQMKLKWQSFAIFVACLLRMDAHHADSHQDDEWTKHDSRRMFHDKQAPFCPYPPRIYSWTFPDILHSFPTCGFYMIFTFLFSFFSVGLKHSRFSKLYGNLSPNRKDRKNITLKNGRTTNHSDWFIRFTSSYDHYNNVL